MSVSALRVFCSYQVVSLGAVGAITYAALCRPKVALCLLTCGYMGYTYLELFSSKKPNYFALAKITATVPLGLGSLLWFTNYVGGPSRPQLLRYFTMYINAAVLGNVSMMVAANPEGTIRGQIGRLNSVVLSLWLFQEMNRMGLWTTVDIVDNRLMIFRAAPTHWILLHALYRIGLVSLPSFTTYRYAFLEASSLSVTCLLHIYNNKALPWSQYFGMADTLVVPVMCLVSGLMDFVFPRDWLDNEVNLRLPESLVDVVFSMTHGFVLFMSLLHMLRK
eukprot:PhF_6_TR32359/c0_g1_i2/m.47987